MKKIEDPLVLEAVAGLIGNSAKLAGNLFNRHVLGFSDTTYPEITAGLNKTVEDSMVLLFCLADMNISSIVLDAISAHPTRMQRE